VVDGSIVGLLDGTLIDPAEPLLRPDDLGVLRGEGVFETTLVVDGEPRDLAEHLARLAVSAQMTGMTVPPPERWRIAVAALVGAWTGGRPMVLRLIASRGPEHGEPVCYVLGAELPVSSRRQRRSGIRVLLLERGFTVDVGASAPWLLAGAKTLSYGINMAALRHARDNGADDVIFIDARGTVLEAPTSSVVVARGRTLITPPEDAILAGITVRRLFRAAARTGWQVSREALTSGDLHAADGVWLASSARLLAPVVSIDGRPRTDSGLTDELGRLLDVPG
jgi:4-amino-4-deoxychorismate lyase